MSFVSFPEDDERQYGPPVQQAKNPKVVELEHELNIGCSDEIAQQLSNDAYDPSMDACQDLEVD